MTNKSPGRWLVLIASICTLSLPAYSQAQSGTRIASVPPAARKTDDISDGIKEAQSRVQAQLQQFGAGMSTWQGDAGRAFAQANDEYNKQVTSMSVLLDDLRQNLSSAKAKADTIFTTSAQTLRDLKVVLERASADIGAAFARLAQAVDSVYDKKAAGEPAPQTQNP